MPQTLGTFSLYSHSVPLPVHLVPRHSVPKPLSSAPGLLLFSPCHSLAPLSMGDQCGYAALGSAEGWAM